MHNERRPAFFSRFQRGVRGAVRAVPRWPTAGCSRAPCATATPFALAFLGVCIVSVVVLAPWLGQDFFPSVDAGQIKLHLRARTGTRIEETAAAVRPRSTPRCAQIDPADGARDDHRQHRRAVQRPEPLVQQLGARSGPADADLLISLKGDHRPTEQVIKAIRGRLTQDFPDVTFYFLPVDIVSQILNFGLPAPIDVQVVGNNLAANRAFAEQAACSRCAWCPGSWTCASSSPSTRRA